MVNKHSHNRCFVDEDGHLLQVLASSAALAISNARLAEAAVEHERVKSELELALTRASDRKLLVLSTYLEERPIEGESTASAARAMGRAASAILERFLEDMDGAPH